MSTYYALLLPQHIRLHIRKIRQTLFRETGNSSFCQGECWILLGKTQDTALTKTVTCPTLPLSITPKTTYAYNTLFLAVEPEELKQLREELGVSHPYSGIYLGEVDREILTQVPPIQSLRLALVELKQEGPLVLWRILSEKRLQKDTTPSKDTLHTKASWHDKQSDQTY